MGMLIPGNTKNGDLVGFNRYKWWFDGGLPSGCLT